jgi:hypothetical protein
LYQSAPSKSTDEQATEVIDPDFTGTIVRDGWASYDPYDSRAPLTNDICLCSTDGAH